MIQRSEKYLTVTAAFSRAQTQFKRATKDKLNPHLGSRYVDLASVFDAIQAALAAEGLAVIQGEMDAERESDNGWIRLRTEVIHGETGEWLSSFVRVPMEKKSAQAYGSTLTYARRYGLMAMCGLCPDDDDGEGAEEEELKEGRRQTAPTASRSQTVRTVAVRRQESEL
jgi:hypothetical protein